MNENIRAIKAIEDAYGLVVFRMGLTHLVDVGVRNLDDESVTECFKQIDAEDEAEKAQGFVPVMTPEFKRGIVKCASELARVSIWDLFYYIQKYVIISRQ